MHTLALSLPPSPARLSSPPSIVTLCFLPYQVPYLQSYALPHTSSRLPFLPSLTASSSTWVSFTPSSHITSPHNATLSSQPHFISLALTCLTPSPFLLTAAALPPCTLAMATLQHTQGRGSVACSCNKAPYDPSPQTTPLYDDKTYAAGELASINALRGIYLRDLPVNLESFWCMWWVLFRLM